MINTVKKTSFALVVLAVTSTAALANSIDVKVVGTISPAACTPALAGGGTIDYGVIAASSLKGDTLNQLNKKQLDFSITCEAPTKIALRALNGRPNTAAGTTETGEFGGGVPDGISNELGQFVFGLGLDGESKVGGYTIALQDVSIDGKEAAHLTRIDGSDTWTRATEGRALAWDRAFESSFTLGDAIEPVAFTTLAGKLSVEAYLNKTSELDLSKPVKLDGLTTLELVYL